jgi:alpha-tubulin suppressor-like RCC1 family protein
MTAPQVPNIAEGNKEFSTKMRAFHEWEATELWAALEAFFTSRLLSRSATSNTSNTITTGNKTFIVEPGKGFATNNFLIASDSVDPSKYIQGQCISYNGTTGELVISNISRNGSGTVTNWVINEALSSNGASLGANTFTDVQNFAQGADIVAASTINLSTATGNILNITGVGPIDVVTLGNGQTRWCRAAAALQLNYHATNHKINTGGINTTLEAGDWVHYRGRNGVVEGTIFKSNGKAVVETPPPAVEPVVTVAKLRNRTQSDLVYFSYMVLMSNGLLKSWGRSGSFALGVGSNVDVAQHPQTPVFTPPIPPGVTVVEFTFNSQAFAVLSNGWVYSCGYNVAYGSLGHGALGNKNVFTRIEYFVSNSISISKVFATSPSVSVDAATAYFLSDSGSVYSCGYNDYGQCGIGSTTSINVPQLISGAITDVVDVVCDGAAYQNNALLLTLDGLVYGTGYNTVGQLGVGDTVQRTAFSNTGLSGVAKVFKTQGWHTTASPYTPANGHSLALLTNGDLYSTGYGAYGQLGKNTTFDSSSFTKIPTLSDIVNAGAVGGKYGYSWAIDSAGELWTWGYNASGNLGLGSVSSVLIPTKVITWSGAGAPPWNGKIAKIVCASAGFGFVATVILDTDGVLYFAGNDYSGFTGATGVTNVFKPIQMPRLGAANEKIIDVDFLNTASDYVIVGLSDKGHLYACGSSAYQVALAGMYPASSYAIRSMQKLLNISET